MTDIGRQLREAAKSVDRGDYEVAETLIRWALIDLTRTTMGRAPAFIEVDPLAR
jgi:hypothetical protein